MRWVWISPTVMHLFSMMMVSLLLNNSSGNSLISKEEGWSADKEDALAKWPH